VEAGEKPDLLDVDFSGVIGPKKMRILCPYPQKSRYKAPGNPNLKSSYFCSTWNRHVLYAEGRINIWFTFNIDLITFAIELVHVTFFLLRQACFTRCLCFLCAGVSITSVLNIPDLSIRFVGQTLRLHMWSLDQKLLNISWVLQQGIIGAFNSLGRRREALTQFTCIYGPSFSPLAFISYPT